MNAWAKLSTVVDQGMLPEGAWRNEEEGSDGVSGCKG
jgi:hypothetical protein